MKTFPNYIPDGQTLDGFIKGVPGLFEDLEFTFRPVLPEEQQAHLQQSALYEGAKWALFNAKFMAGRVVTWALAHDGRAVPVSPNEVRRLQPRLFSRLYGILLGSEPSDLNPRWGDARVEESADEEFAWARGEQPTPGAAHSEAVAKN